MPLLIREIVKMIVATDAIVAVRSLLALISRFFVCIGKGPDQNVCGKAKRQIAGEERVWDC